DIAKLKSDLDAQTKLIEQYKAKEAQSERLGKIKAELQEAKLDPKDEKVCSNVFLESLLACEDDVRRKALIADRAALFGELRSGTLPSTPTYKGGGQSSQGNISEALGKSSADILREIRG